MGSAQDIGFLFFLHFEKKIDTLKYGMDLKLEIIA